MRTWPALVLRFPPAPEAAGDTSLPDLVAAELDGLDVVAIVEQSDDEWQVFFREAEARAEVGVRLVAAFGPRGLGTSDLDVPDGDWARKTQAELGAELGGQSVVSAVLNGKRAINARQASALAERFGVSPAAFIA